MTIETPRNVPGAHAAVLFAANMDRLAAFYRDGLGFMDISRGEDHVVLRRDDFELIVHAMPPAIAARVKIATPALRRADAASKLAFAVADLDLLRSRIGELGGQIDPLEREWEWQGARVIDACDAEGNVIQLRQPPATKLQRAVATRSMAYVAPVLLVANLAQALAYYCDQLGFAVEFVHADFYASVMREACRLHLKCAPSVTPDRKSRANDGHIDVCFGVRDACGLNQQFVESGAEFAVPLRQKPYGREFCLRDVDGNILGFVEAPSAP